MNTYKVYFGISVYVITGIALLISVAPFCYTFCYNTPDKHDLIITLPVAILIIGIFVATLLYAPKSYTITPEQIIINKVRGAITINKADVEAIEPLTNKDLKGCFRKFASGGLFGYIGKFNSYKLGDFYMYAGTFKAQKLLLIRLKNGKRYVISPARADLQSVR